LSVQEKKKAGSFLTHKWPVPQRGKICRGFNGTKVRRERCVVGGLGRIYNQTTDFWENGYRVQVLKSARSAPPKEKCQAEARHREGQKK